ncbi:MAG: response regulator [Deltaproteobacteria bacterium]|nr:response regulator [Deltaproteobacteria bacterium]
MPDILLVDDDRNFRDLLVTGLKDFFNKLHKSGALPQEEEFNLFTAENGKEAIAILQKKKISLLVTDIQMPEINGVALLGYMNSNLPEVPCIAMTAHSIPAMKRVLIKDLLDYIEKPFKPAKLGNIILSELSKNKAEMGFRGISVASFLQIVAMEEQTCLLVIETPDGLEGSFSFKTGELYDAVFGELKGMDAAMKMIPMQSEKINILPLPSTRLKKRIQVKNLMGLIIEAIEAADETNSLDA